MELEDKNIRLRPLHYNDRENLARLANNKKIWKVLRDLFPYPYTIKDAENFIDMVKTHESMITFAIEYHHEFAGVISLIVQQDVYRKSAETGYWIGEPFWGKGIATSALGLLTEYGFKELKLKRIFASVFEGNEASYRVLEKCGYKHEGTFRKAVFKNKHLIDELRFARLSEE